MTWLSVLVRLGGLALLLPIILSSFTVSEVLVWQVLATIATLALLADFGLGPTFARIVAFARGGGSLTDLSSFQSRISPRERHPGVPRPTTGELISNVLATQRRVYHLLIVIAGIGTVLGGTVVLLRPIGQLEHPEAGWLAWALTIVATLLTLLSGASASVVMGFDEIAQLKRNEALISAAQLGATAIVTLLTKDLLAVIACYSTWSLPLLLINRRTERNSANQANLPIGRVDRGVFNVVWASAWRSGVGIVMSAGVIQGSGLFIAQVLPAEKAASYLLGLRFMTVVAQFAQAPFYSKLPLLARLKAERNNQAVASTAAGGMARSHVVFVAGAAAVLLILPSFLAYIGSSVVLPPREFSGALVVGFFFERYTSMHVQVYSLTNHIIWHKLNGAIGLVMLLSLWSLYGSIGAMALPLGMIIGYGAVGSIYASRISTRSLGRGWFEFEVRSSATVAVLLAALLVLYWVLGSSLTPEQS